MRISKLTLDHGTWRAKHNGKYYWFANKTRQQAMSEWLPLRAELQRKKDEEDINQIRRNIESNLAKHKQERDKFDARQPKLPTMTTKLLGLPPSVRLLDDFSHGDRTATPSISNNGSPTASQSSETENYSTVGKAMDVFLADKRRHVSAERIKPRRYANIQTGVKRFVDWIGENQPLTALTGLRLKEYHAQCTDTDNAKYDGKGYYVRDSMATANQFIRYLARLELIPLPAIVGSDDLSSRISDPVVEIWDPSKLKKAIETIGNDYPVLRTAMLLMANCGFRQADVSNIRLSEVDWEKGTITRMRSKTRKRNGRINHNVPTIRFKLWRTTLDALRVNRSNDSQHVLTYPPTGGPLVIESFDPSTGKSGYTDHLGKMFKKAAEAMHLDTDGRTLENIRKTSATLLYNSENYARYREHFLGEAPRSIADRHYTKASDEQFDACLDWLREQYGFKN